MSSWPPASSGWGVSSWGRKGLGQQLKGSRDLSEVQDSCGQYQSPPCACTCCCDMKTPLLQVGQAASPSTPLCSLFRSPHKCNGTFRGKCTLSACRGLASSPSPSWSGCPGLSSALLALWCPPQLQGQGTPALLGAQQLLCSCQTARVAAWAVPRGCCADDGFVSVYWSASCTQSPPQSISPFPPPH